MSAPRRPEDYGAKGDGVTDDTAAFQALVDESFPPPAASKPEGILAGLIAAVAQARAKRRRR